MILGLYFITVLLSLTNAHGYSYHDVTRLRRDLFANYSKHVRPVRNQSDAITVGIDLYLMFIHGLDEKEQLLSFSAWLYMEWQDEYLSWDEDEYNGVSTILVNPTDVWRPDIAVSNSYERMTKFASGDYLIRIDSNGRVDWSPGDIFKTHCTVDITFYPFDTQSCNISLGTWMQDVYEVDVVPLGNISLTDYEVSGEWNVISTESSRTLDSFECCPGESTVTLAFKMTISRRKTFYILTVIIPVLFFSFLNVVDFILPAESGEKMSLSVTVFLSFAFFMSILNESMPQTSLSFSILGIYMIIVMGMGTASVLLSALVIMIHHRVKGQRDMSTNAKQLDRSHSDRVSRSNPPDFLPGIEQFDNLSEKLNGTFANTSLFDEHSLSADANCHPEQTIQGKVVKKSHNRVVNLAQRCDRFFLWFSLGLTICGATVVVSLLTTNGH